MRGRVSTGEKKTFGKIPSPSLFYTFPNGESLSLSPSPDESFLRKPWGHFTTPESAPRRPRKNKGGRKTKKPDNGAREEETNDLMTE